jgi:uroporphyrinogen-III synthase
VKRALLLRAPADAARTAVRLKTLGFEAVCSPVIDIVATGAEPPPGDYDAALVSSAKGVDTVARLDALRDLPFHVVGETTAEAARKRGLTPDIVAGNAAAILPLLLSSYVNPSHFLYLAGRDRQPTLEAGLHEAGHRVTTVEVYVAQAARELTDMAREQLQAGGITAALHYSRRSVEIFLGLSIAAGLGSTLSGFPHIALSDDVAAPLRAQALRVAVASRPDETHLLETLMNTLAS